MPGRFKMRLLFLFLIFTGLFTTSLIAEDQYAGLSLQFSRFSLNGLGQLNHTLNAEQTGDVPAGRYAYGLSLITQRHGRITSSYDLSIEGGISSWNKGDKFSSRMNLLHFFYSLSYTFRENDRLGIYPLLGIGLQQSSLEIKNRNLKSTTIGEVLNGSALDASFMALHLALKLALRMEFVLSEHHTQGTWTKIPIGLEVAYIQPFYGLIDNSLSGNGYSYVQVHGLPRLSWAGLQLSLSIGLRALIKGDAEN